MRQCSGTGSPAGSPAGSRTSGSQATNSTRYPLASLKVFISSRADSAGDAGRWISRAGFWPRTPSALQAQAFRAAIVDGEVLGVLRPGPTLQIQLLASEFLARERDDGVRVGGGIQYNENGQRLGYWLYKKVPSQALNPVSEFVDASRVIHLFWPEQPGFER